MHIHLKPARLEIKEGQLSTVAAMVVFVVNDYSYGACDYYLPHTACVLSQAFGQVSRLYIMAPP